MKGYFALHGFLFVSRNGLFFQPLNYQSKANFLQALTSTNLSFKIDETNLVQFSPVLKGVGDTIIVKNKTGLGQTNGNVIDTLYYFRTNIEIMLDFLDSSYLQVQRDRYSFSIGKTIFDYGNLSVRNLLFRILPDDSRVLKSFYESYYKIGWSTPEWLDELYKGEMLKTKGGTFNTR